jgi:integrase/recombinase XerD
MKDAVAFPTSLETFFTRRLIAQRKASPHTIASYRDTLRLLLQFAEKQLGKAPSRLTIEDLNAPLLGAFLDHLQGSRANGARSRNLRLTAIRSFFRFAALETPQHSGLIQRVLAIPNKRQPRPLVGFLTRPEIDALLGSSGPPYVVRAPRPYPSTDCRSDRFAARRDHFDSTTRRQPRSGRACPL